MGVLYLLDVPVKMEITVFICLFLGLFKVKIKFFQDSNL